MSIYDVGEPAWHPSGSYFIAARRPFGSDPLAKPRLAALDTASGAWRNIVGLDPSGGGDGYGEFSHDGIWIYVSRENPDNANYHGSTVFRIRADGTGSPEIVGYDSQNDYLGYNHPTVSRNDDFVAMTMNGFGAYRLVVAPTPALGPSPPDVTVINSSATGTVSGWSPVSDTTIMFGNEGIWLMPHDKSTISDRVYVAPEYASGTSGTGGFAGASWSPDGKWIIARASVGLILIEVATRRVIPIPIGKSLVNPAWRPE
jgi:Tol biopolymer transport system component